MSLLLAFANVDAKNLACTATAYVNDRPRAKPVRTSGSSESTSTRRSVIRGETPAPLLGDGGRKRRYGKPERDSDHHRPRVPDSADANRRRDDAPDGHDDPGAEEEDQTDARNREKPIAVYLRSCCCNDSGGILRATMWRCSVSWTRFSTNSW